MRILIISDTHAKDDILTDVLREVGSFEILLHAGDLEGSDLLYEELAVELPGVTYYSVAGNNDFFTDAPSTREFDLPDPSARHVFLTHGHQYHIDDGYTEICEEALRRGAQILVCGHTHVPVAAYASELLKSPRGFTAKSPRSFFPKYSSSRTSRFFRSAGNLHADWKNLLVLNPGSLSYPRQEGKRPSYILLESDHSGALHPSIHLL